MKPIKTNEIRKLAVDLDDFMKDYDPGYDDPEFTREELVNFLVLDIKENNDFIISIKENLLYAVEENYTDAPNLLRRLNEFTEPSDITFSGWDFKGGHAEANTENNRLQLFFDEIPNEKQQTDLKINGFKRSTDGNMWQRKLNYNAIYASGYIDFITPIDGRTVHEHQPKTPVKDGGAR